MRIHLFDALLKNAINSVDATERKLRQKLLTRSDVTST